ncbi:hypothetical protein [Agrobacterium sp. V1]|uniref:hypothetical protein n=1 Tax=Agrobacterium sp. V1 TaxID=3061957 RepID=UPI002673572C|nr:hypothetical protein [Agrobacterium sp. V1]MDO3445255.1 hypothetical protein [Agrobacterium sp. V1]
MYNAGSEIERFKLRFEANYARHQIETDRQARWSSLKEDAIAIISMLVMPWDTGTAAGQWRQTVKVTRDPGAIEAVFAKLKAYMQACAIGSIDAPDKPPTATRF